MNTSKCFDGATLDPKFMNFKIFSGPKSGARAVRLLHGFEVDGKKLVAKVDAKNQQLLDTAKDEETKKADANNTRTSDAANEKKNDDLTLDRLGQILDEYKDELKAANSAESKFTSFIRTIEI